jgi:hypothetical protein
MGRDAGVGEGGRHGRDGETDDAYKSCAHG